MEIAPKKKVINDVIDALLDYRNVRNDEKFYNFVREFGILLKHNEANILMTSELIEDYLITYASYSDMTEKEKEVYIIDWLLKNVKKFESNIETLKMIHKHKKSIEIEEMNNVSSILYGALTIFLSNKKDFDGCVKTYAEAGKLDYFFVALNQEKRTNKILTEKEVEDILNGK